MNSRMIYRCLLVITLLVAASLSCNFVMDPINQAVEVGQTAQSVATDIEGFATDINLEGIATDIDLGSVATEIGELATQAEEEGVLETVQAEITSLPDLTGEKPEDIPVMEGEITGMVGTAEFVTYIIKTPFQEVVNFYESQMPANGWAKVEVESELGEEFARLVYEKGGRKAIVNIADIPFVDQVSVAIEIQGQ
jgi:hypothetical protein